MAAQTQQITKRLNVNLAIALLFALGFPDAMAQRVVADPLQIKLVRSKVVIDRGREVMESAALAKPGDILEEVATYTNTASTTVMMVVISDNTPAFTNFSIASCGMPLPAALTSCMVTVQPMVGAGGNIQWTLAGQLNAAQTGNVSFRVTVQ